MGVAGILKLLLSQCHDDHGVNPIGIAEFRNAVNCHQAPEHLDVYQTLPHVGSGNKNTYNSTLSRACTTVTLKFNIENNNVIRCKQLLSSPKINGNHTLNFTPKQCTPQGSSSIDH